MRQWDEAAMISEDPPSTMSTSSGFKMEDSQKEVNRQKMGNAEVFLESFFYILTGNIDNLSNVVSVNLKVLMIFGQPISSVNGLDRLKNLTELWVCECQLEDVSEIEGCSQLKKLYLYSNRIKSVPKMKNLTKLSILSLASNSISTLSQYLSQSLTDINLADNAVSSLGHLAVCKRLEIANFSGNPLKTFDSLYPLTTLPKLRSLFFVDGMHKPTPVTSLVNYRSYVVYHVKTLASLDGVPIDAEEREMGLKFYSRKHRYYRVTLNNIANHFYKEHQRRLTLSNSELSNLKNAITSSVLIMEKCNENSTIYKENKKKLQNYEISQFKHECKQFHWLPKLKKEATIENILVDIEMKHYGNVNFCRFPTNSENEVFKTVREMMDNFICPYLKRNTALKCVEVTDVVHIVNVQHHSFDKFRGVKEVMGIGVMESQFFIIDQPNTINDSTQWPFAFIKDYVNLRSTNIKCTVTNSLAIADLKGIDKESLGKSNMFKTDELSGKRVLAIGYVISDELMGSFTRQETAQRHLQANNETPEHCYHCAMYSSVIPDNVIPVFIVEYSYVFKDREFHDKDFLIPESSPSQSKMYSAHVKFNVTPWHSLSSLKLSKGSLSAFGFLTPLDNISELDVNFNQFSSLFEIGRLFPNLVKLKADFNDITVANFGREMPYLKELSLKYNKVAKYLTSLHLLKKHCHSIEKLELSFNPENDIHDPNHVKYLVVEYFPLLRKLDDDWLEETLREKKTYKLCSKDFPVVKLSYAELDLIASKPKAYNYGALCLEKNGMPTSHCTYNKFNDLLCLYMDSGRICQNVELDSQMSCLKWAAIKNNRLMSLGFLNDCNNVEELDLSHNILLSSALRFPNMRNLTKLDLSWNYLRDVDNLSRTDFPNLTSLNLSYNAIKCFEGLKKMVALTELFCAGNEMKKWDHLLFIKEMPDLKVVDFTDNPIEDGKMLREFLIYHGKGLQYIDGVIVDDEEIVSANDTLNGTLNKNYLSKMYKPNQIRILTDLSVKKCGLKKIQLKEVDLQQLTSVNLEGNSLTTVSSLCHLKQLKHLCLTNNKITSFGDVKGFFNTLETLHLNFNNILDLIPLEFQRFPKLSALYLQDNQLTNLDGLKELKRLQHLVLDRNRLERIVNDQMPHDLLKELYVEYNQLKDLNFLKNLKNLRKLFLGFNKIQDQSSVQCLSSLKKLTELTIMGNPIERLNSHYVLILSLLPRLQFLDGQNVEPPAEQ